MSAPCAKLMTPVALYVSRKPTAASAAIAPSARPLASNAVKLLTARSMSSWTPRPPIKPEVPW